MPSTKKRINLTVSDEIYERLQAYKADNGLESDATACLQLVTLQLKAQENTKLIFDVISKVPIDNLVQLSREGYEFTKENLISGDKK